jgi:hypothetical protein
MLLLLVGCASHHAYPGDRKSASELAVVVAAWGPESATEPRSAVYDPIYQVRLLRIRGAGCPEKECIGETAYAYLPPGTYDFEVGFRTFHQVAVLDLFSFLTHWNPDEPQRLSFAVEAAKQYEIYFDPRTSTYSIFAWNLANPTLDAPEPPGFAPPSGISPCVPPSSTVAPPLCSSDR